LTQANLLLKGAVLAIYFLLRAKQELGPRDGAFLQTDGGGTKWDTLNPYKVFSKFANILHSSRNYKN
jgi:photosystem II stability/assembly factor-like uncharacterized protein